MRIFVERSYGAVKAPHALPRAGDWRRQLVLRDCFRDCAEDMQCVRIDPVQDAARERDIIVIAAGKRSGWRARHHGREHEGSDQMLRQHCLAEAHGKLYGCFAGVYQMGEVKARSATVMAVPGSGFT